MVREVTSELRQVSAGIYVVGHPGEALLGIATANGLNHAGHIAGIKRTKQALGAGQGHRALAEHHELLEGGQSVSHAAIRASGDKVEGLRFESHVFFHTDSAKTGHNLLVRDTVEVEALAARVNGSRHLLRIGGAQDEYHVRWWLLEGLQQCVEGRSGKHVNLVDDVHLRTAPGRSEVHATDDLLANVLDAGATCRIELIDVGVSTLGDELALGAGSVRVGRRAVLAEQGLSHEARRGGLARTARTAEQVRMTHLVLGDGIAQGTLDGVLTHHLGKGLRTVLAIQGCSHRKLLLRLILSCGKGALNRTDNSRGHGNRNDSQDNHLEVVLHEGNPTKEVSHEYEQTHPRYAANNVEKGELAEVHVTRTGDEGGEGTEEGHEAGDDDGQTTVLIEEVVELRHALGSQGLHLARVDDALAEEAGYPVVRGVAQDGRRIEHQQRGDEVQTAAISGEDAGCEEQGVTGQEGEHHHAGLDEHHQEQWGIHHDRAQGHDPGGEKRARVMQEANDEIDEFHMTERNLPKKQKVSRIGKGARQRSLMAASSRT